VAPVGTVDAIIGTTGIGDTSARSLTAGNNGKSVRLVIMAVQKIVANMLYVPNARITQLVDQTVSKST
jgi:hypothetical protein